jgi:arylsulfatase A-like enzyme
LLPAELELVSDRLPDAYQTAAIVSNMVLTDEAMGLASHFDHFDDKVDQRESKRKMFERNAQATTDAALAWLLTERDPERPIFLWVHYIDPHGPYRPPADWGVHFDHEGRHAIGDQHIPPYGRIQGVDDALTYVDFYDSEVAYADFHVDRLLRGYARRNDVDNALIVLTSDHGESMLDHERWFAHTYHVYEEIACVPLFVRGPGVEPGRMHGLSSGIDIAPTLLGFATGTRAEEFGGLDLRRGSELPADRTVFVEASRMEHQWRAAIQGPGKWMAQVVGTDRRIASRSYYDLDTDSDEAHPRAWPAEAPSSIRLEQLIASDPSPAGIPTEYREGIRIDTPKAAPNLSEDQRDILRALGYAD